MSFSTGIIKRSLTVKVDYTQVSKGWGDASISVCEMKGWKGKKTLRNVATIKLRSPSDVRELRRALSAIETYWREELSPE